MDTLGERIQAFRKQNGLSQTQLADKLGISYAQLSRYEFPPRTKPVPLHEIK